MKILTKKNQQYLEDRIIAILVCAMGLYKAERGQFGGVNTGEIIDCALDFTYNSISVLSGEHGIDLMCKTLTKVFLDGDNR